MITLTKNKMTEINWNTVSEEKLNILINKIKAGTLKPDASRYTIMKALQEENAGVGYAQAGNYRVALRIFNKELNKETK